MENNSNYLAKFIPNSITILSLCCGLSSVRFAILNEWEISILLIIFAGIFDFFDGWFATKLKGGSSFGAELDSLNDVISFGVAPSLLIYLWTLSDLNTIVEDVLGNYTRYYEVAMEGKKYFSHFIEDLSGRQKFVTHVSQLLTN